MVCAVGGGEGKREVDGGEDEEEDGGRGYGMGEREVAAAMAQKGQSGEEGGCEGAMSVIGGALVIEDVRH